MKKVNNLKIAVIGCGYWGTVIVLTLFKLGINGDKLLPKKIKL